LLVEKIKYSEWKKLTIGTMVMIKTIPIGRIKVFPQELE